MNNEAPTALILGGTGRTGSLLAGKLARRGIAPRTAARRGADVRFGWDDPATHADDIAMPAPGWWRRNEQDRQRPRPVRREQNRVGAFGLPSERRPGPLSGGPGEFHPWAPTDPGVTVSRHRAPLALALRLASVPCSGCPLPVRQEPGVLGGDPFPGPLHGPDRPEPLVLGPDPLLDVVVDPGEQGLQP